MVILDGIPWTKRCEKVNLCHKPHSEKCQGAADEKFLREKTEEQTKHFYLDFSKTNTAGYANSPIWKQKQMKTSKKMWRIIKQAATILLVAPCAWELGWSIVNKSLLLHSAHKTVFLMYFIKAGNKIQPILVEHSWGITYVTICPHRILCIPHSQALPTFYFRGDLKDTYSTKL